MTTAAMPAPEFSYLYKSQKAHLKLVSQPDEKQAKNRPFAEREDTSTAEDPDDMWDNMPV